MATTFSQHGGGVLSKLRAGDGRRVFYAQYWFRGRRVTEKVGFKEDAAHGMVEARRRLIDEDPSYVPPVVRRRTEKKAKAQGHVRLSAFLDDFVKNWGALRRSHRTFFIPMAAQLKAELGEYYLDELTAKRLSEFIAARKRKVSPATVNHSIRFLKNVLNRAVEWKLIPTSPAATLRQLEEPPARELFLAQAESDALVRVAIAHVRPVVQFALLTGMRRGEILGLTWDRADIAGRRIVLRSTKNGEARVLPMSADVKSLLEGQRHHFKHDHVFSYRGEPLKSLQGSWESAKDLLVAKVCETDKERAATLEELHFHDLRHTWASRQVAAGTSLYELMKLGGWKTLAMVQRYAHFAPDHLRAVADRMNGTAGAVGLAVDQSGQEVQSESRIEESVRQQAS